MGLFKRHSKVLQAVSGITSSDWLTIYNTILREYNATAKDHKRPTEYMKGLQFALSTLDSIRPYNVMGAEGTKTK